MRKTMLKALVAGSLCLLPGIASAAPEIVEATEYLMRPGDQLQVTVYGHADLSTPPASNQTQYVVRPDGKLSFPLLGELSVEGKSVAAVTRELQTRLAEYLVRPQVSVNVTKLGTTRVYVLGEVRKPGLYEIEKSHTLLDALGKAEGFTEMAAKKKVFVIRRGKQEAFLRVNLNNLLTKGDVSQNIVLGEGDCIYLTSNNKISFAKDIMPFLSGIYMISEIQDNDK